MSDTVLTQIIIVGGSIVTTYLTVKYKDVLLNRVKNAPPKDRADTMFDGYERLIAQQQKDIDRKDAMIQKLERLVQQLRRDLDDTTNLLISARREVKEAKSNNMEMSKQLQSLREDYNRGNPKNV